MFSLRQLQTSSGAHGVTSPQEGRGDASVKRLSGMGYSSALAADRAKYPSSRVASPLGSERTRRPSFAGGVSGAIGSLQHDDAGMRKNAIRFLRSELSAAVVTPARREQIERALGEAGGENLLRALRGTHAMPDLKAYQSTGSRISRGLSGTLQPCLPYAGLLAGGLALKSVVNEDGTISDAVDRSTAAGWLLGAAALTAAGEYIACRGERNPLAELLTQPMKDSQGIDRRAEVAEMLLHQGSGELFMQTDSSFILDRLESMARAPEAVRGVADEAARALQDK